MRILALDAGEARCGLAVCDPTETVVTPLEIVERPNTRKGLENLARIVRESDIEHIVVGLPLTLAGGEGVQAQWSRRFADRLAGKTGMAITMYDERLTTRQAERGGGEMPPDSRAAAHLLEAYLAAGGNR